jgi:hypothetical protein
VGDGDHGAREVVQEALQPGHALGVQVVGRLVEQQHVRAGQQQAAQGHAAALAAGQLGHVRVPGRQAQGVGGHLQLVPMLCASVAWMMSSRRACSLARASKSASGSA